MNLNQEALAKAVSAVMLSDNDLYTTVQLAITTYLTEINKTHALVPRELGLMDFRNAIYSAGLITVSALWASQIYDELIDAADALAAGGK